MKLAEKMYAFMSAVQAKIDLRNRKKQRTDFTEDLVLSVITSSEDDDKSFNSATTRLK